MVSCYIKGVKKSFLKRRTMEDEDTTKLASAKQDDRTFSEKNRLGDHSLLTPALSENKTNNNTGMTPVGPKEISHGRGSSCYDRPPNQVFLNYLAAHKLAYQKIPRGQGERLMKRIFQKERLRELVEVIGLDFQKVGPASYKKCAGVNTSDGSYPSKRLRISEDEERALEKIRAALIRAERAVQIAFPGLFHICLGPKTALLESHPPNAFLKNLIRCHSEDYSAASDKRAFVRDLYHKITCNLQYRFVERKDPTDIGSFWLEAESDKAFEYLSREFRACLQDCGGIITRGKHDGGCNASEKSS